MPPKGVGPADRHVVLEVGAAERHPVLAQGAVPSAVEEDPRLLDVALLPQRPAQLHQAHLDLRMPAQARRRVGTERGAHVVGGPPGDVHQLVRARGPQPGHRGLQQVPRAVQLVPRLQVAVPGLLSHVPVTGVQIAVGVLGAAHARGEPAHGVVHLSPPGAPVLPGQRLQQLVDLGVGEAPARPVAPGRTPGDAVEVGQPARPLHPVLAVVERGGGVGVLHRGPEAGPEVDLAEPERADPAPGRHHRSAAERVRRDDWLMDGHTRSSEWCGRNAGLGGLTRLAERLT